MDLEFQKVQEILLPGFSAFCALSGKLIVFINTRETLTTVMDSVALLCHTHHKLNMKRRELIKPELNPLFTRFCKEDNLKDMAEVKKAGIQMLKSSSATGSTSNQQVTFCKVISQGTWAV